MAEKRFAIRMELMRNGITNKMLAKRIGISESTVYRWLNELMPEQEERICEAIANILAEHVI